MPTGSQKAGLAHAVRGLVSLPIPPRRPISVSRVVKEQAMRSALLCPSRVRLRKAQRSARNLTRQLSMLRHTLHLPSLKARRRLREGLLESLRLSIKRHPLPASERPGMMASRKW